MPTITMKVLKEDNKLKITFPYNAAIVNTVKKIDGRKFDVKNKLWTVPIIQVKKTFKLLSKYGFQFSSDVIDEYNTLVRREKKIKKIRKGKFSEKEEELFIKILLPLLGFQKIGAGFMCSAGSALLGDEPGCGKTIQSIAITRLRDAEKVLILCPSILKLNWKYELEKWGDTSVTVIDGTKKKRDELWKNDTKFYIMNYELLLKDIDEINKTFWDYAIADEATRISNPKSKQSKLIKTIKAKHRIALTGTPFNNSVQDVWNIIDFCQPGFMGTYWEFMDKYCMLDNFRSVVGYKNMDLLKENIQTIMIRRLKSDVLHELPEKIYENIFIELSPEENKIYNAVKDEVNSELKELDVDTSTVSHALVKIIRLMQVTDSLELVSESTRSTKVNVLQELLTDILHNQEKAIIYTRFEKMAKILEREMSQYNPLLITGKVNQANRDKNIKNFMEDDKHQLLIMTDAGTFGLNLQKAKYIIHFDLPWSISKIEQREGRAHRIGQKSNVVVYKIIASGTIDEYVLNTLYRKDKQSAELLSDKKRISRVKITKKDIQQILG